MPTKEEKEQALEMAPEQAPAPQEEPDRKRELRALSFLTPRTLDEAVRVAELLAKSELVPKDYRGKPESILVAIGYGQELGLSPMASLQSIAVINGRPCVWGDAMLGLVQASGELEWIKETDNGQEATCEVKRRGQPAVVRKFSMEDAKSAGLLGRDVWRAYPRRMRQMRARAFALRDAFADVLKGLRTAEEVKDIEETEVTASATSLLEELMPKALPDGSQEAQKEVKEPDSPGLFASKEGRGE